MIEINSAQNDLVKYCVKLADSKFRKSEKMILIDGIKTISGLIQDGFEFEYIFTSDDTIDTKIKAKNIIKTNSKVLNKISTLKTPVGMVGIIKEPEINKNIFLNLKKIALIEDIKDPGNLGTIIRSACAFSIDGIILFGSCCDLYNSKTLRATAQNMFKIPVLELNDIEFIKKLKKNHKLISTVVNTKNNFFDYKFNDNFILAFGSEADGLSKKITELSDNTLTFKMKNNVESLNLAICASIAFAYIDNYKK